MPETTTKDKTGRGEVINLRASRRQKLLIDRAAEALGRSRSDFMLSTACREAESVLLDHPQPKNVQPEVTPAGPPPELVSPGLQPGNSAPPPPEAPAH